MPFISRFLGLVIFMNWDDHKPPHFHARYGDHDAMIEILTGNVTGYLPLRALSLVQEWRELHKEELLEDWELAQRHEQLKKIEPLE
jgi:hypothetical protein